MDIAKTFNKSLDIVERKNNDYSEDSNPFANFTTSSIAHVGVPQAILVRTIDKLCRTGNLLVRPAVVLDENLEDTIIDGINYLAILLAYLHSTQVGGSDEVAEGK